MTLTMNHITTSRKLASLSGDRKKPARKPPERVPKNAETATATYSHPLHARHHQQEATAPTAANVARKIRLLITPQKPPVMSSQNQSISPAIIPAPTSSDPLIAQNSQQR